MPSASVSSAVQSTAIPQNAAQAAVGSAAPSFSATTLDGKSVALRDFSGKVLVLNFWATWCPPCRAETPDMIASFHKLGTSDVAFLGIDTTETAPVVKSFVAIEGLPYPVALADPDAYNAFGIAYIPTTVVVDGRGIVRARWTGGVTPDQLATYVASARAGKNSYYVTPEQKHVDALLALSQFHFSGGPAEVTAQIAFASRRLKQANDYIASISAGDSLRYDPAQTQRETGELELASANALAKLAKTPKQKLVADAALGAAYADLNRFADAARVDMAALAISPHDPKLVAGLTTAYYRLHDYDAMAKTAAQWTAIAPNDPDGWDQLGLANQRRKTFAAAVPAYQKALALMIADAGKKPIGKDGEAVADVADESLDFADVYVSLGDAKDAQRTFDQAQAYAKKIPDASPYAALKKRVPERKTEGMMGVELAKGGHTALALANWTGANLPGSVLSTYRYRLVAVAPPGKSVTLTTRGLKSGWIASFCQDRLCSPGSVTFTMPPEGMKTYEFQLVPPSPKAVPGPVAVGAADSNWVTTTQ